MRIAHFADIHYAPEALDEVDRCFDYAIDQAIAAGCETAVIAGDTFDHRVDLHSPAVAAVLRQMRRLADHMPLLILQGTFSHDTPGALEVFRTIGGRFPVHVANTISQVVLIKAEGIDEYHWQASDGWAFDALPLHTHALFSCLPSVNKGAVAAVSGCESAAEAVGEHVAALLRGWSVQHLQARTAGLPTIVVSHGTVSGCITEHGVPMAGMDHEYTTGSLFAAEASAVLLGHIHQHQQWERDGRRIGYAGSIGRLHFGEITDKGFLIWEVKPNHSDATFFVTPAKTLLQIDFDGPPDMDQLRELAAKAEGAHVRIRWSIDEEFRHSVDKDAIRDIFAHAAQVKLEARINPVQRTRSEGINRAVTLADKIGKWAAVTNTDPEPLCERLADLEHLDPEEIVRKVLA